MNQTQSRRHWWKSRRVQTIIVLVMMFAGWFGWTVNLVRGRVAWQRALIARQAAITNYGDDEPLPPWRDAKMPMFAGLLGGKPVKSIVLDAKDGFTLSDAKTIASWFPEAEVRWQSGTQIVDVQNEK
jgi:hypothetical protein